jgi:peptidoglycan-N-acetylglucosamine deacetylase
MKFFYNPPFLVKKFLTGSYWTTVNGKILFTFDDGPVQGNTENILKQLDHYKIKALFFCVGNNIIKNPSLAEEIVKEGHSIGNHTMNHKILDRSGINEIAAEIIPFNKAVADKTGVSIKYFRPPHGRLGIRLNAFLKKNQLKNIMWSLLTYDYKDNLEEVKKSLKYLRGNSIIVLHDSIKSKSIISGSIETILNEINKNNYSAGSPEECLK